MELALNIHVSTVSVALPMPRLVRELRESVHRCDTSHERVRRRALDMGDICSARVSDLVPRLVAEIDIERVA
jgi:hypothetical protein